MLEDWNPQNIISQLKEKQQFYVVNSVITNKVLDCDQERGNILFLNQYQKGKESQEFKLVKKNEGYLIQCKVGGYLTRFQEGNRQKLYLDKKLKKDPKLQLFKISSKIGMKGQRIETLDKKAIGTFGKFNEKQNWEDIVLLEENSQQNQLWNFTDSHGEL